jgi:hypothetical protein
MGEWIIGLVGVHLTEFVGAVNHVPALASVDGMRPDGRH